MGIRFIFGRAGSGKSEFCLKSIDKKIRECDKDNKLILLVPDQYTFQSEKKLLEHTGEKSLLRAEVLSFKRMANRVFDRIGGRTENIIEDSGKNMLIYKLLKENMDNLHYFNKISRKQGFIGVVSKTITEFKKYNIAEETLINKKRRRLYNIESLLLFCFMYSVYVLSQGVHFNYSQSLCRRRNGSLKQWSVAPGFAVGVSWQNDMGFSGLPLRPNDDAKGP